MQRRLIGGLNLDDIACASRGVVENVFVALNHVQIVVGNVLHVETPAGVAAGAEGIVDHVTDAGDAQGVKMTECPGAHGEEFIGPEEIWSLGLGDLQKVAIETIDGGAG